MKRLARVVWASWIAAVRSRSLLAVAIAGCATAPPPEMARISRLEDARAAGDLPALLRHADARVRARAALALGRIADPTTFPALGEALRDADTSVRDAAAFALGIAEDEGAEAALLASTPSPARDYALGRVGGDATIAKAPSPRALLGLALRQRPLHDAGRAALVGALGGPDRLAAAAALGRAKVEGDTSAIADALEAVARDADAEVRAYAVRALGKWAPDRQAALAKAMADAAVGVRVQAARALAGTPEGAKALAAHVEKEASNAVLLAALEALAEKSVAPPARLLDHREPAIRCAARRLAGDVPPDCPPRLRAAAAKDEAALRALGADAKLGTAVAERAAELGLVAFLGELLASDDMGVLASAADGLKTAAEKGQANSQFVPELIAALGRLRSESDVEAMLSIAGALGAIGGKEAVPVLTAALFDPNVTLRKAAAEALGKLGVTAPKVEPAPQRPTPGDPAEAESRRLRAVVETDRGRFEIELYGRDAPRTVASFVHLARRGFFDGVTFHRVVPDFVAQGGDPRGDGYGGPGYALRCEYNLRPYARGAVGMALAGKDTGGSQWFVALSPEPHLDGKYTVFGRIARGMEVVDAILPGDRVRSVRIADDGAR